MRMLLIGLLCGSLVTVGVMAYAAGDRSDDEHTYRTFETSYGSVQYSVPTLSGSDDIGTGGSVLISKQEGLWVTAFHVLPEEYPAFKEDAGYLKVNDLPAKLLCASSVADVAILKTATVPATATEAILASPRKDVEVFSVLRDGLVPFSSLQYTSQGLSQLLTRAPQRFRAKVESVFEALLNNGTVHPDRTGEWFFSLDKAVRTGFSGGGLMDKNGHVLGLAVTIDGGITYATSAENIQKLRTSKQCASKLAQR